MIRIKRPAKITDILRRMDNYALIEIQANEALQANLIHGPRGNK